MRGFWVFMLLFLSAGALAQKGSKDLPIAAPGQVGLDPERLQQIDTICNHAIAQGAMPGCVVLVARRGKIAYAKSFGYLTYDNTEPVYLQTIYDLASCTKICATTLAVMKLVEQGKLSLHKTLGDYLPWVRGTDKAHLRIWDILLHQAGLKAFIPFFKETEDTTMAACPLPGIYTALPDSAHSIRVAEDFYMRNDWEDTIRLRILQSELGPRGKYVYSDNDFIFLAMIVKAITGMRLDEYVKKKFYDPMGLTTTGFLPRERFSLDRIAPTEDEHGFRDQLLWGDVHDPGAAMFGGVAGHAGLFSDAADLALVEQMLLNGGKLNGKTYLQKSTIDLFTGYHSRVSRRGLGFDKPEKDNAGRHDPYPCLSASALTFGHTGYTGTCIWVDPRYKLIYIFLSNRVNPFGGDNRKLSELNVRSDIQQTIYEAMGVSKAGTMKGCCHVTK